MSGVVIILADRGRLAGGALVAVLASVVGHPAGLLFVGLGIAIEIY